MAVSISTLLRWVALKPALRLPDAPLEILEEQPGVGVKLATARLEFLVYLAI